MSAPEVDELMQAAAAEAAMLLANTDLDEDERLRTAFMHGVAHGGHLVSASLIATLTVSQAKK